ncbi:MAG: hypothetical protein FADNKDHG_01534 [Holosporales bacterium]
MVNPETTQLKNVLAFIIDFVALTGLPSACIKATDAAEIDATVKPVPMPTAKALPAHPILLAKDAPAAAARLVPAVMIDAATATIIKATPLQWDCLWYSCL